MSLAISIILAYLVGSLPTAYLVGIYTKNIDIRQHGSGNMGTMNTGGVLGWRWALIVFIVDLAKGIMSVYLSRWGGLDPLLTASAAVIGHCYPIWLRFRGGKGLATALGAMLTITAFPYIAVFVVGWTSVWIFYRAGSFLASYSSKVTPPIEDLFSDRANLMGITVLMIYALLSGPDWWLVLLTAIIMSRLLQSLLTKRKSE
ncbi:MAG: glycerol-3-phosphate acyltransferase [Deltaproteobacteria bacterium]